MDPWTAEGGLQEPASQNCSVVGLAPQCPTQDSWWLQNHTQNHDGTAEPGQHKTLEPTNLGNGGSSGPCSDNDCIKGAMVCLQGSQASHVLQAQGGL